MAKSNTLVSILFIIIILTVIYLIYSNLRTNFADYQPLLRISVPEARARRFGLIIDVRTPKERELLGYYPNSIPIPLHKLQQEVPMDISSKNTHILVYSNDDNRALIAAEILYKMGYKNTRYIQETFLSLLPGSSY